MAVPETVPLEHVWHAKYERLIARAKEVRAAATIVVHPCDETSLRGTAEAAETGLITPTLIGPSAKIARLAREMPSTSLVSQLSTCLTAMPRQNEQSSSFAKPRANS